VGAQNRGDAPVEVPAHGDLLAGGFRVEVHNNDAGFDRGEQSVGLGKGIVGGADKNAAHELHYGIIHAASGCAFKDAVAGQAGLQICRPQHAARALLACGRH